MDKITEFSSGRLLRIDASPRLTGSHSRGLGDHFENCWLRAHPGASVVRRSLATQPVPALDQPTIEAFMGREGHARNTVLSDALIAELSSATEVLITSPLYNFAMPASLKAWIDQVVRAGRTFEWGADGPRGLLAGRAAWLLTARGGPMSVHDDFQVPAIETALTFMGLSVANTLTVGDLANPEQAARRLVDARHEIDGWFGLCEPEWEGAVTESDKRELAELRAGQIAALKAGDADAYARLCTDDVRLMLPGFGLVAGRAAFVTLEKELLGTRPRRGFSKRPERVVLSGDLAVETGWQSVMGPRTAPATERIPLAVGPQKYTHVFRRTMQGWRFAVLMSNSAA